MEDFAKYGEQVLALAQKAMMWGAAETGIPVGTIIIIVACLFVLWKFTPLFRRS